MRPGKLLGSSVFVHSASMVDSNENHNESHTTCNGSLPRPRPLHLPASGVPICIRNSQALTDTTASFGLAQTALHIAPAQHLPPATSTISLHPAALLLLHLLRLRISLNQPPTLCCLCVGACRTPDTSAPLANGTDPQLQVRKPGFDSTQLLGTRHTGGCAPSPSPALASELCRGLYHYRCFPWTAGRKPVKLGSQPCTCCFHHRYLNTALPEVPVPARPMNRALPLWRSKVLSCTSPLHASPYPSAATSFLPLSMSHICCGLSCSDRRDPDTPTWKWVHPLRPHFVVPPLATRGMPAYGLAPRSSHPPLFAGTPLLTTQSARSRPLQLVPAPQDMTHLESVLPGISHNQHCCWCASHTCTEDEGNFPQSTRECSQCTAPVHTSYRVLESHP